MDYTTLLGLLTSGDQKLLFGKALVRCGSSLYVAIKLLELYDDDPEEAIYELDKEVMR